MSHINNIGPVNWSIEWYTTDINLIGLNGKLTKKQTKKSPGFPFLNEDSGYVEQLHRKLTSSYSSGISPWHMSESACREIHTHDIYLP